ncbi:hypothetical protein DIS24_g6842 [Lasiodiplodia hormozganensis]|uniref:Uncharacterized protein n=1 Tax=Lasiodiplodia hormozganensis TaxID=869390 RepID=A0AA40CV19_9PEZI|nr:hypothetical protein DIS24_g6842 [Lasiodiplodia hormozganensis]
MKTNDTSIETGDNNLEKVFKEAVESKPQLSEVFELSSGTAPDLSNPIHPLFRQTNFPSLSTDEYEGMELALRLASLFITVVPMLEWFVKAAYDFEVVHPTRTNKKVLEQVCEYNRGHYAVVSDALLSLADFVDFDFDIFPDFVSCGRTQLYVVNSSKRRKQAPEAVHAWFQKTHQQRRRVRTKLHADFRAYARDALQGYSPEARLRYSFFLAVTITHEVCHAFGLMKSNGADEPYFSADAPVSDWGTAWEMWALGGEINPWHPSRMAPTVTLLAADWVDRRRQKINGGLASSVVPMDWIAMWFRQHFWAELESGSDVRTLPLCDLRVWQQADRRGSVTNGKVSLLMPESPQAISPSRGRKRKVSEGDDRDSGSASPEMIDEESSSHKKRSRTRNGEAVSPKTARIDNR